MKQTESKPQAYIADLDGTINDNCYHYHYGQDGEMDLDNFEVMEVLKNLSIGAEIFIVTGRSDKYRILTEYWLKKFDVPYHSLKMKPDGYKGCGIEWKAGVFKTISNEYEVMGIFEDRLDHAIAWRKLGYTVFDVGGHMFNFMGWKRKALNFIFR